MGGAHLFFYPCNLSGVEFFFLQFQGADSPGALFLQALAFNSRIYKLSDSKIMI